MLRFIALALALGSDGGTLELKIRVTDRAGHPPPRATVVVYPGRVADNAYAAWIGSGHNTDPKGEVAVSGLPDGQYTLHVMSPGYLERFVPVQLPTRLVAVTLAKGGQLHGIVHDEKGMPINRAPIQASLDVDSIYLPKQPGHTYSTQSGPDGSYTIGSLVPGAYSVGRAPTLVRVEVREDSDVELDLTLVRPPPRPPEYHPPGMVE
jgi:hypothetical protein